MSSTSDATTSATTSVDSEPLLAPPTRANVLPEAAGVDVAARAQHRRDTEDQARQRGQDEREDHGAHVHRRHIRGRKRHRHERCQQRHREHGEHHAEAAAQRRENEALGRQLTDQPLASRADGRPDGELFTPAERAHEQQVGDVRAGDQQHAERRAADGKQQQARLLRQLVAERVHPHARVRVLLGILLPQLRGDHRHLGVCAGDRHAGLEPPNHFEQVVVAILERLGGKSGRQPHLLVARGEAEVRRHHTTIVYTPSSSVTCVPTTDRSPPNARRHSPSLRINAPGAPSWSSAAVKSRPIDRLHAERGQEIGGDGRHVDPLRLSARHDVHG